MMSSWGDVGHAVAERFAVAIASVPSKRTVPVEGLRTPAIVSSSVDLPAPLLPMMATICPGVTLRVMPSRSRRPLGTTRPRSSTSIWRPRCTAGDRGVAGPAGRDWGGRASRARRRCFAVIIDMSSLLGSRARPCAEPTSMVRRRAPRSRGEGVARSWRSGARRGSRCPAGRPRRHGHAELECQWIARLVAEVVVRVWGRGTSRCRCRGCRRSAGSRSAGRVR